ncbi:MAG TPA: DUF1353 domain-containing protein [Dongiaceae bacterium]|nr:DUF1353 domain-containing protein [Dongiaceae bacterium]
MNPEQFSAPAEISYGITESKVLGYDVWRIMNTFRFYPHIEDKSTYVEIPEGFLSDGATVPRPFWWLLPAWGSYGQAAITHDYLCETGRMVISGVPTTLQTRAEADKIFKEAMLALGVPTWKKNVMYLAVRTFSKLLRHPMPDPHPALEDLVRSFVAPSSSQDASGASV